MASLKGPSLPVRIEKGTRIERLWQTRHRLCGQSGQSGQNAGTVHQHLTQGRSVNADATATVNMATVSTVMASLLSTNVGIGATSVWTGRGTAQIAQQSAW